MTHNNNNNNHNKPSLHNYYGDLIPFGDPNYYQGYYSHYYTSKHIEFRNALRDWVDNEIIPYVNEWDESYKTPKEIWKKAYDAGWLPGVIGVGYTQMYYIIVSNNNLLRIVIQCHTQLVLTSTTIHTISFFIYSRHGLQTMLVII